MTTVQFYFSIVCIFGALLHVATAFGSNSEESTLNVEPFQRYGQFAGHLHASKSSGLQESKDEIERLDMDDDARFNPPMKIRSPRPESSGMWNKAKSFFRGSRRIENDSSIPFQSNSPGLHISAPQSVCRCGCDMAIPPKEVQVSDTSLTREHLGVQFKKNNRYAENKVYDVGTAYSGGLDLGDSHRLPDNQNNYFISQPNSKGVMSFGIVEGEKNYNNAEMNSELFAREFCHAERVLFDIDKERGVTKTILHATRMVLQNPLVRHGAISAVTGQLNSEKHLSLGNLGSTWAGIYRNSELLLSSHPAQHTVRITKFASKFPVGIRQDDDYIQKHIHTLSHQLIPGDVVIFYTSSVRKFISPQAVIDELEKMASGRHEPQTSAENLVSSTMEQARKEKKYKDIGPEMLVMILRVR